MYDLKIFTTPIDAINCCFWPPPGFDQIFFLPIIDNNLLSLQKIMREHILQVIFFISWVDGWRRGLERF